jgi:hypothetical protein
MFGCQLAKKGQVSGVALEILSKYAWQDTRFVGRSSQGGSAADDDRPGTDLPGSDQSILDVGIFLDKLFEDLRVGNPKNQHSLVDRVAQCARHHQLAARMGGLDPGQVFAAEGAAAFKNFFDIVVK